MPLTYQEEDAVYAFGSEHIYITAMAAWRIINRAGWPARTAEQLLGRLNGHEVRTMPVTGGYAFHKGDLEAWLREHPAPKSRR